MYQELSWYIDDNRFSNIVSEIEDSAMEYSQAFDKDAEGHKEKRRKFHNLVLFHAKESGYIKKLGENFDIDGLFFAGNKINRKALNDFEKEIVKNHMYQKHLWDFMGTTGNFTLITKMALATKNKSLSDLLPISFKKKVAEKSPISAILSEDKESVPIYIYSDGSISTLYDKNKAQVQFNTTDDKTGFDWKRTGWDPNYTIEHSDLDIVYDSKKDCFVAKKKNGKSIKEEVVQIFAPQKAQPLSLKLVKTGKSAILYDPFYVFLYKKLKDVIESREKLEDNEYLDEMLESIDLAMHNLGVETISAFVKSPSLNEKLEDDDVLSAYKLMLGKRVADDVKVISVDDARKAEQKSIDDAIKSRDKKAGQSLGAKLGYLLSLGLTGKTLTDALETDSMMQPLDYKNKADCESMGLDDFEYESINRYEMSDEQNQKFNHALFNAYDNYALLSTSGLTRTQLADLVYDRVVLGKKTNTTLTIDTTLEKVCSSKSVIFDDVDILPTTRKAFEEAIATIPSEKRTKRLENALDNAVKRYGFIKKSTGMSEREVVNNLVVLFVDNFMPSSSITYINSSSATNQRLYLDLSADEMIDKLSASSSTKMAMKPIDYSLIDMKSKYNLFENNDVSKLTNSTAFKKSGLSAEALLALISKAKSSVSASSSLTSTPLLPTKLIANEVLTNDFVADIFSGDIVTPDGLDSSLLEKLTGLNSSEDENEEDDDDSETSTSSLLSTIGNMLKDEYNISDEGVAEVLDNIDLDKAGEMLEEGADIVSNIKDAISSGDTDELVSNLGDGVKQLIDKLTGNEDDKDDDEDDDDEDDDDDDDENDNDNDNDDKDDEKDNAREDNDEKETVSTQDVAESIDSMENIMALGESNIAAAELAFSQGEGALDGPIGDAASSSTDSYVSDASDMLDDLF